MLPFDHTRALPGVLAAVGLWLVTTSAAPSLASPSRAAPLSPFVSADSSAPARGLITDHVVVISVDGLRPDAITRFRAGTLQRLIAEGSYTLNAKTIDPSLTLPSHTSMLTGQEPDTHGVFWNRDETDTHGVVAVPTVFARARERGFRTAAFFSKSKFHHLQVPNTLDHTEAPDGDERWNADRTVGKVERYLEAGHRPNLLFVHIGEPDYAGHMFSWMSWFYGRAVRKADRAVARVLEAADGAFGEGNYAVIVTADHGGHGWTHGSTDRRDITIPWITWGEGVRTGTELPDGVRTMDTAATALWLLGLDPLGVGRPVQAAFSPAARRPLRSAVHGAAVTAP
ncbi:MAG TPA: alkaline phosphatase family protein [Longimicrobiaceae bacterium]|nr:alkaline phosphatase family protein [Longimicrobiaceae bacterium]